LANASIRGPPLPERLLDLIRRAVSQPDPDHSDVFTEDETERQEIGVLTDNREALGKGKPHDRRVVG
jgi:hypothetical protein